MVEPLQLGGRESRPASPLIRSPVPFSGGFVAGLPVPADCCDSSPEPEMFEQARADWASGTEEMMEVVDRMEELLSDGATTVSRCRQLFSRLKRERGEQLEQERRRQQAKAAADRAARAEAAGRMRDWWAGHWCRDGLGGWRGQLARERSALRIQAVARGMAGRSRAAGRAAVVGRQRAGLRAVGGVLVARVLAARLGGWVSFCKDRKQEADELEQTRQLEAAEAAARRREWARVMLQAITRGWGDRVSARELSVLWERCGALERLSGQCQRIEGLQGAARAIGGIRRAHAASVLRAMLSAVPQRIRWCRRGALQALGPVWAAWQWRMSMLSAVTGLRAGAEARRHARMRMLGAMRHFVKLRNRRRKADTMLVLRESFGAAKKRDREQASLLRKGIDMMPSQSRRIVVNTPRTLIKGPNSRVRRKKPPIPLQEPLLRKGNDMGLSAVLPPALQLGQLRTNKKAKMAPGPLTKRVAVRALS